MKTSSPFHCHAPSITHWPHFIDDDEDSSVVYRCSILLVTAIIIIVVYYGWSKVKCHSTLWLVKYWPPLAQTFNEWVSRCNAAAASTFSRLLISRANFSFVVSIPSRFSILALAWDKPHLTSVTWQSIILHKENSSIPFQVQVWEEHPLTPSSIPRPLLLHLCIISEMEKKEIRTLRHTHSSSRRVGI